MSTIVGSAVFSRAFAASAARAGSALALLITSACAHSTAQPATTQPTARLWIGGDVFLGTGGNSALASIPSIVGGAPGIVNLEGPLGKGDARAGGGRADDAVDGDAREDNRARKGPIRLLQAPQALGELRAAGVVIAGIANNHARDGGPDGAAATMRALSAVGVAPAGGAAGPAIITLGGLRVVVTAHDLEVGVPEALREDLIAARRRGDVLIATFHVTGPPTYLPRPELLEAVAIALEAGAAVIAAHGTHELARVERRGRAVIAWGLGNLAFACACTDETSGALLEVALGKDGAGEASIIPIDAGLEGAVARASGDPELAFDLLEALGTTRLERRGDRARF